VLNVDNTKWLPEILKYRVDGICIFEQRRRSDRDTMVNNPQHMTNLEALVGGLPVPYASWWSSFKLRHQ